MRQHHGGCPSDSCRLAALPVQQRQRGEGLMDFLFAEHAQIPRAVFLGLQDQPAGDLLITIDELIERTAARRYTGLSPRAIDR